MSGLTDSTFADEVLEQDLPVVVVFGASWCQPCKALAPHVEKVAAEFAGKVKVLKADIEEARFASQANGVRAVPTAIAFQRSEPTGMIAGGVSPDRLREFVKRFAA